MVNSPDAHSGRPTKARSKHQSLNNKWSDFSVRVVIGISLIIGLATVITFYSSLNSSSIAIQPFGSPLNKISQQSLKIDRNFLLVQNEFGWNGTSGGPTMNVNKGDNVQITIINAGNMAHNFAIAKVPLKTENLIVRNIGNETSLSSKLSNLSYNQLSALPCPDCQVVFKQASIENFMPPLSQQVVVFKATEVGSFKYFCMVRGHVWLGMIGTLIVQPSEEKGGA